MKKAFLYVVVLVISVFSSIMPSHASIGAEFPIATTAVAISAAFDGTNYLVGLEYNHNGTADQIDTHVGAQMVSSTGAKIGSVIETSQHGIAQSIAFDGTNYLMVWEDNQGLSPTNCNFALYGQFINKAGSDVGTSFVISSGIEFDGINILSYGSGKYLVTYTKLINVAQCENSTNRYIAGRIISPDGTMGSEFRISTGNGAQNSMTFDGTNFFVVWVEDSQDYEVRGRFVSPTGALGTEISINATTAPSDNIPPTVAFDGTNYMVVWNDEVNTSTGDWDVFGQLVKPDGSLVGGVINIAQETGGQFAASIAFDGANYFAVWIDRKNDADKDGVCDAGEGTCWDVYGQYISKDGTLVGNKVAISTEAGNQLGVVGGYNNGKYLVLVSSGIVLRDGITQGGDVYGIFITPSLNKYTLTVSKAGAGNGNITSSPSGIDCGSVCSAEYDQGAVVTLTPVPDTGSVFAGWSGGGCTGSGLCITTINADTTITSTFTTVQTGNPKISVNPMSVNFGSMGSGDTSNPKTITIRNTGKGSLAINSITITGTNAGEFNQTNDCSTISPGNSCAVNASFTPAFPFEKKSATISIYSNDPKKPTVNVKLLGKAAPCKISASPKSVNFGSVQVGNTSSPKIITIKNTGISDLVISDINITGTNAGEFNQTNGCSTITSGNSCTINATFTPTTPSGAKSATMSISSNDPKKPTVNVKLKGKSVGSGQICTYSILPTSQSFDSTGGTGSVSVTAPSGCSWTAVSNTSWITITSGSSGSGSGTVAYSVATNTSTSQRTGTMTIAGQTFTVTQAVPPEVIETTSQTITAAVGGTITLPSGSSVSFSAGTFTTDQMVTLSLMSSLPQQPPSGLITGVGPALSLSFAPASTTGVTVTRTQQFVRQQPLSLSAGAEFTIDFSNNTATGFDGSVPLVQIFLPQLASLDGAGINVGAPGYVDLTNKKATIILSPEMLSHFQVNTSNSTATVNASLVNWNPELLSPPPDRFGGRQWDEENKRWVALDLTQIDKNTKTCVLVHGIFSKVEDAFHEGSDCVNLIADANGCKQVIGFNYRWWEPTMSSGNAFAEFLQQLGLQNVIIEAHSLGGDIALSALSQIQTTGIKVPYLVTLGSPIMGTPAADKLENMVSILANFRIGLLGNFVRPTIATLQDLFGNSCIPDISTSSTVLPNIRQIATGNHPEMQVVPIAGTGGGLELLNGWIFGSQQQDSIVNGSSALGEGSGLNIKPGTALTFPLTHIALECHQNVIQYVGKIVNPAGTYTGTFSDTDTETIDCAQWKDDISLTTTITVVSGSGMLIDPYNGSIKVEGSGKEWTVYCNCESGCYPNPGEIITTSYTGTGSVSGSQGKVEASASGTECALGTCYPVTMSFKGGTFSGNTLTGTLTMSDPFGEYILAENYTLTK